MNIGGDLSGKTATEIFNRYHRVSMKQCLRLHVAQHAVNPILTLWRVENLDTGELTLPTFSSAGAVRNAVRNAYI